jgi:hypothetical protein
VTDAGEKYVERSPAVSANIAPGWNWAGVNSSGLASDFFLDTQDVTVQAFDLPTPIATSTDPVTAVTKRKAASKKRAGFGRPGSGTSVDSVT